MPEEKTEQKPEDKKTSRARKHRPFVVQQLDPNSDTWRDMSEVSDTPTGIKYIEEVKTEGTYRVVQVCATIAASVFVPAPAVKLVVT